MAAACKSRTDLTPFHLVKLMVNNPSYQLGLCLVGLLRSPNLFHPPVCLESGLIDTQRSQKDRILAEHRTLALCLPKHLGSVCVWPPTILPALLIFNCNIEEDTHQQQNSCKSRVAISAKDAVLEGIIKSSFQPDTQHTHSLPRPKPGWEGTHGGSALKPTCLGNSHIFVRLTSLGPRSSVSVQWHSGLWVENEQKSWERALDVSSGTREDPV